VSVLCDVWLFFIWKYLIGKLSGYGEKMFENGFELGRGAKEKMRCGKKTNLDL